MKKPAAKKAPVAMVRPAAAKGQQTLHDQSEVALAELDRFFPKGQLKNSEGQTYMDYCRELRHEWHVEKDHNSNFKMVNSAGELLSLWMG